MITRLLLTTICCITVLLLSGCASTGNVNVKKNNTIDLSEESYVLHGRNYSFAIYNNEHRLLTHPVEDLLTEMKWRKVTKNRPISDIYIVSHGWNYTQSTAIANYHNYIEMIDEHMRGRGKENDFQPYFIFVTWTSSVRPITNLAKGILPFGLDSAIEPITNLIDKVPLHLFTGWKESLNATHNALGTHYPNHHFLDKEEAGNEQLYGFRDTSLLLDADNLMGTPTSVSALIYKLIQLKTSPIDQSDGYCKESEAPNKFNRFHPKSDKCVSLAETKLHAVGHSYGAKLLTIASMEALRRWMLEGIESNLLEVIESNCIKNDEHIIQNCGEYDDLNLSEDSKNPVYLKDLDLTRKELARSPYTGHITTAIGDLINLFTKTEPLLLKKFYKETTKMPIESLVLFNPAFHPGELSYPVDISASAPIETLKFIPRKAIVFTRHDYANGALFGFSGAILNTQITQWFQQGTSEIDQYYLEFSEKQNSYVKMALTPVNSISQAIFGSASLAYSLAYTQIGQAIYSLSNLPMDFWHHVTTGAKDGWFDQKNAAELNFKSFGKGVGNTIDFFLPVFPPYLRDESEQGLYRISRPGLGKTGLNNLAKGRWAKLNLAGLSSYVTNKPFGKDKCELNEINDDCINTQTVDDPETRFAPNIDAETFKIFSKENFIPQNDSMRPEDLLWQREKFYSFDASQVYDTFSTPFVGAHSDLREEVKNKHTFNFVLRFTQTDFNNKLKK